MKITHTIQTAGLLLSVFCFPLPAFSQGGLTPPGAPAATMKSLDQIEPRTIVNAANTPGDSGNSFIISQPGSYYLTTNLVGVSGKNGIKIAANNVTLDLNGFVLLGVSGTINGIDIPGAQTNITVRNGTISGWVLNGVFSEFESSFNMVFERLNVSGNGQFGINSYGGVVRDCNCHNNLGTGIVCFSGIVSGCTANNNGASGININCGTVSGCSAQNNGEYGIYLSPGTASGCFVKSNVKSGIYVYRPGSEVIGNTCIGNNTASSLTDAGIDIDDSNNRVEGNHVTVSGHAGIQVDIGYINNVIIKNTVAGSGANNYVVPVANDLGPVGTAATATSPWANISH
jgi:hypothetical protein